MRLKFTKGMRIDCPGAYHLSGGSHVSLPWAHVQEAAPTGTWNFRTAPNGQPLEVFVDYHTGRALAQRVPGDTAGKATVWFDKDGRPSAPTLLGERGMPLRLLSVCVPHASVNAQCYAGGAPSAGGAPLVFSTPPPAHAGETKFSKISSVREPCAGMGY